MSDSQIVIQASCEVHSQRSGHLIVRREEGRIVLDAHADECCVITLDDAAAALLFNTVGEWLG